MADSKIAFVFPGQGSQKVGMGADLSQTYPTARKMFEEADNILHFPISKIIWEGPAELLNDTMNTQPALLIQSSAVLFVLQERYPNLLPDYVAGHSMGEISALVAAKVLSFSDALKLTRARAELMKQAGLNTPGNMAAIIGLGIKQIEDICSQVNHVGQIVQVANDNCPGQVVVSGTSTAINEAINLAKQIGGRAVPLNVSVAAHSALMKTAQFGLNQIIEKMTFNNSIIPIIGNVSAKMLLSVEEIREDLNNQLTSPVLWTKTIQSLIDLGVTKFIEIGNGSVLCGLIKRIDNHVDCISITNPQDIIQLSSNL
ncbi:MAG: ACP S-malonyltransferase [Anaerolineaceae bacterium]